MHLVQPTEPAWPPNRAGLSRCGGGVAPFIQTVEVRGSWRAHGRSGRVRASGGRDRQEVDRVDVEGVVEADRLVLRESSGRNSGHRAGDGGPLGGDHRDAGLLHPRRGTATRNAGQNILTKFREDKIIDLGVMSSNGRILEDGPSPSGECRVCRQAPRTLSVPR